MTEIGIHLLNEAGDVYATVGSSGEAVALDPASWGWHGPQAEDLPEWRRTTVDLASLPGFTVDVAPGPRFVPGPRPSRSVPWEGWDDGAAPPAAALSRAGENGTLAYFDRLTDALGRVARRLPSRPERGPFLVHDFVSGRIISISHTPPPPGPGGPGTVYLVTDGHGLKIGYTESTVAQRIAGLQTGNPRTIETVATIHGVGVAIEGALHAAFGEHLLTGEWFDLSALRARATDAGGWAALAEHELGPGDWRIEVHDPVI